MQTSPFSATQPHKLFAWGVLSGLCIVSSHAWALLPAKSSSNREVKFSTLYWIEAQTKLIDPALPMQVEMSGESFAGQVLQLEQKGVVLYEQKLPEGSFRLLDTPFANPNFPLVVKVKSPNQPDNSVDLPLNSSEKRSLFSERPELLALAPTTIPKPLGAQFPGKKLDEDIEFEMDFLKGNAFRNLTPLDVKRLGSARPGNVDADIYSNGRLVSRSTVKFAVDNSSDEVRPCISPKLFQQLGVSTAFVSSQGKALSENTASASTSADCLFNLGASVSSSSDSSAQYSLTASGGLVLHRGGVLATPSLGDTFAILEVPNGKGVSVAGSTGRINSSGYGVVPYLSPYYVNDVQISLEGASTDLEVDIPTQKVAPVEGSISRLKFNTNSGRPLLIIFQTSTGVRVPIGATVTDSTGLEVGTVGQGSRALVRINKTQDQLSVTWGNAPDEKCLVDFVLDAKTKANSKGFTNLKLSCLVGAAVDKTAQK